MSDRIIQDIYDYFEPAVERWPWVAGPIVLLVIVSVWPALLIAEEVARRW